MDRRGKRIATGVVAAAATLLLHSLFLAVALFGGGMSSRLPDLPEAVGAGSNSGIPEGDSFERRITVTILTEIVANPNPALMDAFLADALKSPTKIDITGPDAVPLPPLIFAEDGVANESNDAELIAREKMVGIYQGQIRARIERAWKLPAQNPEPDGFSCRALIRQNRDGSIKDVELPYDTCDGTPAQLQSVANAIFSASPLPAPPHPGVFVDSFSIVLRSEAGN